MDDVSQYPRYFAHGGGSPGSDGEIEKSLVTGDCHAGICGSPEVRSLRATQPLTSATPRHAPTDHGRVQVGNGSVLRSLDLSIVKMVEISITDDECAEASAPGDCYDRQ